VYEFANAMARRGHNVYLVHRALARDVNGPHEVSWCAFEDGIEHCFTTRFGEMELPAADFILDAQRRLAPQHGLPLIIVQGHGIGREQQLGRIRSACPKVCVARWLVDDSIAAGVDPHELIHVPVGLDHGTFKVLRPIEHRPRRVAMMYGVKAIKGARDGIAALEAARAQVPDFEAVAFARSRPSHKLPSWVRFVCDPPVDVLVGDVYNACSIYLCPSLSEGFGYPSVEAMACGCALVTTRNGGADEYAVDRITALTCEPGDSTALGRLLVMLLTDDERRRQLATAGLRHVERFDWDVSAARLEAFLHRYAAAPESYGFGGWEALRHAPLWRPPRLRPTTSPSWVKRPST
jgi:glycosyltransferase involved in cell wall biosynthesis